jgi:hypothetical protein
VRGWRLDRNPLRRGTDRLETVVLAVLFAVVCAAVPLSAAAASGWEHSTSLRELRVQRATCHEVRATVLDDAQDVGPHQNLSTEADVRWAAPDGRPVTELIRVDAGTQAGSVIWIWTNASGQVVTPLLRTAIPDRDGLAAAAAVAGLVTVALLVGLAVRRTLNRRRMTAWGVDWMKTEPRWNTRR